MSFVKSYIGARDLGMVYIPLRVVTFISLAICTYLHIAFNDSRRPDEHKLYAYYMFPFWTIPNLFLIMYTLISLLDLLCTSNRTRDGKPANIRRVLTLCNDFCAGIYFFSLGICAAVLVPLWYADHKLTQEGDIAKCAGAGALCLIASVSFFGLLVCTIVGFKRGAREHGNRLRQADEMSEKGSLRSSYASSRNPAPQQMSGPSGTMMAGAQPQGWSRRNHDSMVGVRF